MVIIAEIASRDQRHDRGKPERRLTDTRIRKKPPCNRYFK